VPQRRLLVLGVGIFVLVVLSLQIFLLMVGLEAWLTYQRRVAWGAAVTSIVLAAFSVTLYRFLDRPPRPSTTTSRRRRTGRVDGTGQAAGARTSPTTNRHTV
jgi:membrane protein implicated in regulation of membrane protease activity